VVEHLSKNANIEDLTRRNIQNEASLRDSEIKRGLIGSQVEISGENKVYIQGRSDLVLRRMVETGHITEDQKNKALKEIHEIQFTKSNQDMKAAHFVLEYILPELEKKYGKELVEQGGLKVYTTLDPKLQDIAEKAIKDRAEGYQKNTTSKTPP
jgi:penicillin-binding protein 1A